VADDRVGLSERVAEALVRVGRGAAIAGKGRKTPKDLAQIRELKEAAAIA
jgi:hypothetical protein